MNNGTNGTALLDALKKRESEIRAKIAQERVRQQKRSEKQEERLHSLVGRSALIHATQQPEFAAELRKVLQSATLTEGEGKLLREMGWA